MLSLLILFAIIVSNRKVILKITFLPKKILAIMNKNRFSLDCLSAMTTGFYTKYTKG